MNGGPVEARADAWVSAARERHGRDLTFPEIRRGLQALSALYVEKRGKRLAAGGALDGAGKRAAFALYYAPLHFTLLHRIASELGGSPPPVLLDLGCGTGAAGAGWACALDPAPSLVGVDRDAKILDEARATWASLGLRGRTERGEAERAARTGRSRCAGPPQPLPDRGVLAAFLVNELAPEARERLLEALLAQAGQGNQVLVVEPIARGLTPWWPAWSRRFLALGGRDDDWKFQAGLPAVTLELGRAAGLRPLPVTGRSLALGFPNRHSPGASDGP